MLTPTKQRFSPVIIQSLDIEDSCVGIYANGSIYYKEYENLICDSSLAWKHSSLLEDEKYTYLSLYLRGASLSEYSETPSLLRATEGLLQAQRKAALTAKLNFSDMCFFDIIPDHLLYRFLKLREAAITRVFENIDKPKDYEILHKIHVLTHSVSNRDLCVNGCSERVKYDIFSSATGRLATERGSFPILNISKEERANITPQNDMFLELDLNGAEIRTLLALSGNDQPDCDIHKYNKEVMASDSTRKEAKARFFAWLYNPEAVDKELDKLYNKDAYREFYKEGHITTPFGRKLKVDERRALNYLTQSTTSDIVLENAYKIMKFLKDKESFVAFTMHDSVVLDFSKKEHAIVEEIKKIFETNMFGRFRSTVNIGKDYGNLKEVEI